MTLIEILVVMAIVITMAAVLVVTSIAVWTSTKKKKAKVLVNTIGVAIEAYKLIYRSYPPDNNFYYPDSVPDRTCRNLYRCLDAASLLSRFKADVLGDDVIIDPWEEPLFYDSHDPVGEEFYEDEAMTRIFRHNSASFDIYSFGPDRLPDSLSDESDDIANYKR